MLNNTVIKNIKATAKTAFYHDSNGLYLVVSPKGLKSFYHKSKSLKKKLGVYPNLSLKEARELNTTFKKASKVKNKLSFKKAFNDYLSFYYNDDKNHERYLSIFNNYFLSLHERPLHELKSLDLIECLASMTPHYESAKRFLACLKRFFDYAEMREQISHDPAVKLKIANIIKPVQVKHFSTITEPSEISLLIDSIYNYKGSYIVKLASLLIMFTAIRTLTARAAKWSDFDLQANTWTISAADMKSKKPFKVFLHESLVNHLKKLKSLNLDSLYLFPTVNFSKAKNISDNTIRLMFRRLGYSNEEFTPHGFRAMFSTLANENAQAHGLSFEIIELCLAHEDKNAVRRAYNRALREQEKAKLWKWWGDYLISLNAKLLKPLSS